MSNAPRCPRPQMGSFHLLSFYCVRSSIAPSDYNEHHRGCGAHLSMPRRIPGTPALILRGGGRHTVLSPRRAEPGQAPGHPAQDPVGIHQPWGPRAAPQTCSSPISTSLPGPGPPDLLLLGPSPTTLPPPTPGCRPPYPPSPPQDHRPGPQPHSPGCPPPQPLPTRQAEGSRSVKHDSLPCL